MINVLADGRVKMNRRVITDEALKRVLKAARSRNKNQTAVIRAVTCSVQAKQGSENGSRHDELLRWGWMANLNTATTPSSKFEIRISKSETN